MSQAADGTITPSLHSLPVLTASDINTTINHEPRVLDVRLAEVLGFKRLADIRSLIDRHREALERFGPVIRAVRKNTGRGRPAEENYLNKRQALYLCTKSETPHATEATIAMVEVFDAHLRGTLTAPEAARSRQIAPPRLSHREREALTRRAVALAAPEVDRLTDYMTRQLLAAAHQAVKDGRRPDIPILLPLGMALENGVLVPAPDNPASQPGSRAALAAATLRHALLRAGPAEQASFWTATARTLHRLAARNGALRDYAAILATVADGLTQALRD